MGSKITDMVADNKAPSGGGGFCMFVLAIVNIAIGATVSLNLFCPNDSIL